MVKAMQALAEPPRRRLTVDEYERMGAAGIFHEDERVELLDGELFEMAAIGSRHAACVKRVAEWFSLRVLGRMIVSVQDPIRLSVHSEPQPDIALLRRRADFYASAHPGPQDVLLVIEVADSSVGYDRDTKIPLYAAAGIPEVWLIDLKPARITVYREPRDGGYQEIVQHRRGAVLTPLALPDLTLQWAEIFG